MRHDGGRTHCFTPPSISNSVSAGHVRQGGVTISRRPPHAIPGSAAARLAPSRTAASRKEQLAVVRVLTLQLQYSSVVASGAIRPWAWRGVASVMEQTPCQMHQGGYVVFSRCPVLQQKMGPLARSSLIAENFPRAKRLLLRRAVAMASQVIMKL